MEHTHTHKHTLELLTSHKWRVCLPHFKLQSKSSLPWHLSFSLSPRATLPLCLPREMQLKKWLATYATICNRFEQKSAQTNLPSICVLRRSNKLVESKAKAASNGLRPHWSPRAAGGVQQTAVKKNRIKCCPCGSCTNNTLPSTPQPRAPPAAATMTTFAAAHNFSLSLQKLHRL